MLAIVKQSKLLYLLIAIVGSLMEGFAFCMIIGFYVTNVLKVHTCTILLEILWIHITPALVLQQCRISMLHIRT